MPTPAQADALSGLNPLQQSRNLHPLQLLLHVLGGSQIPHHGLQRGRHIRINERIQVVEQESTSIPSTICRRNGSILRSSTRATSKAASSRQMNSPSTKQQSRKRRGASSVNEYRAKRKSGASLAASEGDRVLHEHV